ncbi:MAG: hypothetical protein ISS65_14560 [Desulfobacterales bacterium]|nr:hypothetical protein [Desulfobacterales bacterium]
MNNKSFQGDHIDSAKVGAAKGTAGPANGTGSERLRPAFKIIKENLTQCLFWAENAGMERYFQHQAELAQKECNLRCPEDCSAPGCWMAEVIVEVSLFDLIRLSLVLNTPVSSLFFQHCFIGLENLEINSRYQRLLIKLKKPCNFLQKAHCRVHGSKPLNCILFPEYHQLKGMIPDLVNNPIFKGFPCLKAEIKVSQARSNALETLRGMSCREEALSNHFIFDTPSFIIDSKPLTKLLKQDQSKDLSGSMQDYEQLVSVVLKSSGFFEGIMNSIYQLDTRLGKESLFEKLKDDALMKPLLEKLNRPDAIYRLKGNRFIRLKRTLQPPEVIFM